MGDTLRVVENPFSGCKSWIEAGRQRGRQWGRAAAGRLPTEGRGQQRATRGPIGGRALMIRKRRDRRIHDGRVMGIKAAALGSIVPRSNRPNHSFH
jgi:hypothetical protein